MRTRQLSLSTRIAVILGRPVTLLGWLVLSMLAGLSEVVAPGQDWASVTDLASLEPGFIFHLFPLIGLAMIAEGIKQGWRDEQLLRGGALTSARLVLKRRSAPAYELVFEFDTEHSETRSYRLHTHETAKFEDDPDTLLFYDPLDPDRASLLRDMAGELRWDEVGGARPRPGWLVAAVLVPILSLAPHLLI